MWLPSRRFGGLAASRETRQAWRMIEQLIFVTPRGRRPHDAVLRFGPHHARCALGAAGLSDAKTEGDRATPIGVFALRRLWYRPDRVLRPESAFPISEISQKSGWCDASEAPLYNRPIERPLQASHETLWRRDRLYDVFFELGYNDNPPEKGRGSAIFLHLQKNNFQPTLGCVAVSVASMRFIIAHARPGCRIAISASG